jgi:hypothetical protein
MHEKAALAAPTLIGPGSFYVTGEDNLRVVIRNSLASAVVTVEGRFLSVAGEVTPFVQTIAPASDRTAGTTDFRLGDGWILNVSARVTSGDPQVGQVYVRLLVIRGLGAAPINIGTLAQGYATNADDLAWPGAPIRSSVEGPGWIRTLTVADPAAGADFAATVPTGARWRPLAVHWQIVSSATAANRETALRLTDGTNEIAIVPCGVTQTASTTRRYSFFHTAPRGAGSVQLHVIAPMPRLDLVAGNTIESVTAAIDATDQISAIVIHLEEWIEG